MVAPSVLLSAPLKALPIGVRAVEMITASVIFYPRVGRDIDCHIGTTLILLRIPHQMIGGITVLNVDRRYPFEVMTDVQFVAHAHAAMKLHGLLGDKSCGIADFRFRSGSQFGSMRLSGREAHVQMLRD